MTATEKSGIFDTGTFDNAQFDTVNQPSSATVNSTETTTFNLGVSSFSFVFSDLGREIQRDLTSFAGVIDSTVDSQLQKFKTIKSSLTVFSENDFRLGKKAVSTVQAFSNTDSTVNIVREISSTIKSISQERIIFELKNKSQILVDSTPNFFVEYNRAVSSFVSVFAKAFQEISPRDTNLNIDIDKVKQKTVDIKKKTEKTLSGDINK